MAEGTTLLTWRGVKTLESSNLSLSAKIENRNWKPKGFATQSVAQKVRFDPYASYETTKGIQGDCSLGTINQTPYVPKANHPWRKFHFTQH